MVLRRRDLVLDKVRLFWILLISHQKILERVLAALLVVALLEMNPKKQISDAELIWNEVNNL